ncbi:MAG: hypothetical protein OQK73_00810 [Gammaproteobacteria bacterium]|nr:hypothetical protein [Gammaproteobacteria bacterium]
MTIEKDTKPGNETNKEMKEIQDSQASLVNALESIRGLLEKSETKLSAARESLSATPSKSSTIKRPIQAKNNDEPIVPVLDDVVIPEEHNAGINLDPDTEVPETSALTEPDMLPLFADLHADVGADIPVVTDIPVINEAVADESITAQPITDISEPCREELIEAINTIRLELDDQLNYMMAKSMAALEVELRDVVDKKLTALTELIEKK